MDHENWNPEMLVDLVNFRAKHWDMPLIEIEEEAYCTHLAINNNKTIQQIQIKFIELNKTYEDLCHLDDVPTPNHYKRILYNYISKLYNLNNTTINEEVEQENDTGGLMFPNDQNSQKKSTNDLYKETVGICEEMDEDHFASYVYNQETYLEKVQAQQRILEFMETRCALFEQNSKDQHSSDLLFLSEELKDKLLLAQNAFIELQEKHQQFVRELEQIKLKRLA